MKLMVAVPSTFTSVEKNRMLRTYLIGQLARYLSIFRVTHVFVYYDEDPYFESHALGKYIAKTLKYCVTPPWLKKLAFPIEDTDRFYGILPPLQIKSHISPERSEWGVVTHEHVLISKNLNKKISTNKLLKLGYGKTLPQLVALKNGKLINPFDISREEYIGFWPVYFNRPLNELISRLRKRFINLIVIGTSRKGELINKKELSKIKGRDILLVFGGHHRGIMDMPEYNKEDYFKIINLFKDQETKTIRTEEAIPLTLEAFHTLDLI